MIMNIHCRLSRNYFPMTFACSLAKVFRGGIAYDAIQTTQDA